MKLSVVQKMLVLCSLAVLGLGLLAGLGLWQMERVYGAASFANEHTVPSLVALNKLDAHVAKLRQRVARHVFYGDDAATMAKIDETIVEGNQRVAEALAEYRKTIVEEEDRRRFDHVSSLKAELDASFAPALTSSRAGRKGEARELLRRGDALGKELSDALVDYIHYHTALAQTSDETAREIHAGARLAMLLIVVATMALVGFMSFAIARSVTRPLLAMQETIVRIGGSGDLRIRAPVTADDELGTMARHLNDTLAQIGASMREVIDVASRVEGSAEHLAAAAKQLTESADTQAATAADMAATVEEVSTSIGQVAEHAADTEALAGQASSHVAHGAAVVREASAEMSRNAAQVSESVAHIAVLSEQSRQVGGIVQVIREIADQTNLLALNAAIEAARAGETGRGFAVVADEVRKLAERTATATAEIGQLIDSIQHDTAIAVGSMEASSIQANKGAALAEEAGRVFAEVSDSTQLAAARVHDIAAAAREQNTAGQAIAGNVEKVARMSEENSAATASVADSAMHLQGLATALERAIGRFRV